MSAVLVCPSCQSQHGADERFCAECGMPLIPAGETEPRLSSRRQRARKIKPQYAQGALVRVAWTRDQAEAELIEGMLLEEGIPCVLRRPPGFDVPDFMASGPRELLVASSGFDAARDVLLQGEVTPPRTYARQPTPRATRLLAAMLLAVAVLAVVLFMATHVWD